MDVFTFAAGMRLAENQLLLPTPGMDRYFEAVFDFNLRQNARFFAVAALAHAALHRLNHKRHTSEMAALACGADAALVFGNAFRGLHPDLFCAICRDLPGSAAQLMQSVPQRRRLAAALFTDVPPADVCGLPGVEGPLVLVALLPAGARLTQTGVRHYDLPGFSLALSA